MLCWKWYKTEFRLSLLFPAVLILMLTFDIRQLIPACLTASLLHELGHLAVMRLVHDYPSRITFGVFGACVERRSGETVGYAASCAVSLAGPMANLLFAGVSYAISGFSDMTVIHGALALFNLMPVATLDGGEALYALLCLKTTPERAGVIERTVSLVVLIPLTVLGLAMLFTSGYNFTLLLLCAYLTFLVFYRESH